MSSTGGRGAMPTVCRGEAGPYRWRRRRHAGAWEVARQRAGGRRRQRAHCGTNRRQTLLDARLQFDAPMGILVAGYILELARIWQLHYQDKQHTHTETYMKSNRDHTFNYIYQSNITQRVHRLDHKAYVSSKYYTKNNCYLTQSL
jgi:hypothetical protein